MDPSSKPALSLMSALQEMAIKICRTNQFKKDQQKKKEEAEKFEADLKEKAEKKGIHFGPLTENPRVHQAEQAHQGSSQGG